MLVLKVSGCLPPPPPPSWGGFDPSPHLLRICLTSPPATSIENEHVIARFRCWWALHLTMPPHHPPASKMSMSLLIFNAGGLHTSLPPHHHPPPPKMSTCVLVFNVGLLSTSLPPTTTTENKYTCAHFQWLSAILPPATIANKYPCTRFRWCSATYLTTTCSHHRKQALILIFQGV